MDPETRADVVRCIAYLHEVADQYEALMSARDIKGEDVLHLIPVDGETAH